MSREAMQMALEALESDPISHAGIVSRKQAITAIRQALVDADDTSQERVDEKAKREQKPVALAQVWRQFRPDGTLEFQKIKRTPNGEWEDYTTPPKREWVWLTDDEADELVARFARYELLRRVEAKLKEKNI